MYLLTFTSSCIHLTGGNESDEDDTKINYDVDMLNVDENASADHRPRHHLLGRCRSSFWPPSSSAICENGTPRGQFDVVVIAHNGKCANRLLSASGFPLVAKQMKKLDLSSIWALLAAFDDPLPTVNFEGAFVKGVESLSWMGNNSANLGNNRSLQHTENRTKFLRKISQRSRQRKLEPVCFKEWNSSWDCLKARFLNRFIRDSSYGEQLF